MPNSKPHTIKKYISPLYMDKLRGRMLVLPKQKTTTKTDFLIVYGLNSTIEKWSSLAYELRKYGNVTMPDLPGMGGMQSFYKLEEYPTIDNYADYLAAFIKLKFRRKKIVIIGMSFGFVVVTRMLQKYPDIVQKVELLFNVSGFSHNQDMKISNRKKKQLRVYSYTFSHITSSKLYRSVAFDEAMFPLIFKRGDKNYKEMSPIEKRKVLKNDIKIYKKNDTRTHMFVLNQLVKLDNTKIKIDLPVWNLVSENDEYLSNENVRKNLELIYKKSRDIKLKKTRHQVSPYNMTEEFIADLMPYKLKSLLNRQNNKK